jgi:hypothetical protein
LFRARVVLIARKPSGGYNIDILFNRGVSIVQAVRAVYDGRVFVPEQPVNAKKNQAAIITILDEIQRTPDSKAYLKYAGRLSDEGRAELEKILESTRGVDSNEW